MNKTLVIVQNIELYFFRYVDQNEFDLIGYENIVIKNGEKIDLFWKSVLHKYNKIIMFDSIADLSFQKLLLNICGTNSRIYIFYWNSIRFRPSYILDRYKISKKIYLATYDQYDSRLFNMKYYGTCYCKNIVLQNKEKIYDVFFCGRIKKRGRILNKYYLLFKEKGLKSLFYVYGNVEEKVAFTLKQSFMDYRDYLSVLENTTAILDISKNQRSGLSMRVMEALFFHKKLITNNRNIRNQEFYNKNNVFILGLDEINNLPTFLKSEYVKIDQKIINKYDMNSWIQKFL